LGQRSRKRGRRQRPVASVKAPAPRAGSAPKAPAVPKLTRSQRRDEAVRRALRPLGPGERPGAILASVVVSGLIGVGQLIAFIAGLKIRGQTPAAGGIIVFAGLMIACAIGLWRLWYGAVLGFMALLAIVATLFSLYLIEASNLLGLFVALAVISSSGYLFWKLVRVLSRIQMPRYPGS
jgi:hypothetical protein